WQARERFRTKLQLRPRRRMSAKEPSHRDSLLEDAARSWRQPRPRHQGPKSPGQCRRARQSPKAARFRPKEIEANEVDSHRARLESPFRALANRRARATWSSDSRTRSRARARLTRAK